MFGSGYTKDVKSKNEEVLSKKGQSK